MKLIEPTAEYGQQILAYRKAFLDSGDSMDGTDGLRRMEDPEKWIEQSRLGKDPDTAPEGRVPATQYMLLREEDQKIVGMLQIRHVLNDYLAKYGGHIGYSVAPDERRKGYAGKMLARAKDFLSSFGFTEINVACLPDNEASRKTILSNGGELIETVFLEEPILPRQARRPPPPSSRLT